MTKKKRSSGVVRYRFDDAVIFTFSALRASDAVSRQQVVRTLEIRNGGPFHDFEACAAAVPRMFGIGEEGLHLERYSITREGERKPSYQMWVYFGEHGLVFEVGSKQPTSVHCVQGHFWSVDEDDLSAVMLAKALDRASPF